MATAVTQARGVLADRIPGGAVRDFVIVGISTLVVAISAQVVVPLLFTPVPLKIGRAHV